MNKTVLVTIEGRLEPAALRVLRGVPGVDVRQEPGRGKGRPDAFLGFAGKKEPVVIEFKRRVSAATAHQLLAYASALGKGHLIVVAGDATGEARDILAKNGIGVVDGRGNAHLELPGLLLHIEGKARRPGGDRDAGEQPTRLTGKAGVAAQALLLEPDRDWKVQDLAAAAETSTAFAHRVLARLDSEGLAETIGVGPRRVRRLTNATALFDLWVEENRDRAVERTTVFRLARDPRQLATTVGRKLAEAGVEYALTGAAAASRVAPFVTALPVTDLWISAGADTGAVVDAMGGEVVDTGHNVVLAQTPGDAPLAFRRRQEGVWVVNPLRLYYDLRRDPRRGSEQAERIREEVIRL